MSDLSNSPSQSDMSDLSNLSNSPSHSDNIKEREENVSDISDLSSSPSQSDMSDFSNSPCQFDMSDLSNSPSQSDMSDLSNSPSQSEPQQYAILALPALRHIPEILRRNNRRTFHGLNAVVQDSEEVITNILDNEHVIDAFPLSFAYPEGSHGRGGCGCGCGDSSGHGGGRGEYQGTNTSSEIDDAHSTSAGIFTENPPIQAQPSSTNVMDDDVSDETSEHHM